MDSWQEIEPQKANQKKRGVFFGRGAACCFFELVPLLVVLKETTFVFVGLKGNHIVLWF